MQRKQFRNYIPHVTNSTSLTAFFFLIVFLFSSCAGSYRTINPKGLTYGSSSESGGIKYAYQHNVLAASGNKKYAKKEAKRSIKLVAIEITNSSDRVINFKRDVKMYMGDRLVLPVEPAVVHEQLRQPAGLFMLWGLLWVVFTKCDGTEPNDCSQTPIPVGLLIGIGNTATASSANKKFLAELTTTNLLDKEIAPGETVRGLIGISTDSMGSISLKID